MSVITAFMSVVAVLRRCRAGTVLDRPVRSGCVVLQIGCAVDACLEVWRGFYGRRAGRPQQCVTVKADGHDHQTPKDRRKHWHEGMTAPRSCLYHLIT